MLVDCMYKIPSEQAMGGLKEASKIIFQQEPKQGVHVCVQIGKKTEGELIDLTPDRKEGFAVATFDLEAIRWQRARCAFPIDP